MASFTRRNAAVVINAAILLAGLGCSSAGPTSSSDAGPNVEVDAAVPATCSAETCGSGCCLDGKCMATNNKNCGAAGGACVDCTGHAEGSICEQGACGCTSNVQCPENKICDSATHRCGERCTASSCATGCCSNSGICSTGTDAVACGEHGTCTDCSHADSGHRCIAGACGCNSERECPKGKACDAVTHTCTTGCSATQPCNGVCCNGTGCQQMPDSSACGSQGMCVDCSSSVDGTTCIDPGGTSTCGCTEAWHCPVATTCDKSMRRCTDDCSATRQCNDACCSDGKCKSGLEPQTCGSNYSTDGMCGSCASNSRGPACNALFDASGGMCGCQTAADCVGFTDKKQCQHVTGMLPGTTACCAPASKPCVEAWDCCSGSCHIASPHDYCN